MPDVALADDPSADSSSSRTARARGVLSRSLHRLDRGLPIAVKLVLPFAAVGGLTTVAFLLTALPVIRGGFEHAYGGQARELAKVVQVQYTREGVDRAALMTFVHELGAVDSDLARIRIYRVVSGAPVLWASSDPAELSSYTPQPSDLAPLTTGATTQATEELDGVRVLETIEPLRSTGGLIDATVAIYIPLAPLDAAVDEVLGVALRSTGSGVAVVMLVAALTLYGLVLRPIRRLHHAALRVAAGDLTVRLPEGDEPPASDEIVNVARAFDHMARMVVEQRAEVEHLAMTDALTGLPNRRWFDQRIEAEARRAARLRYPLAVLLVDLDGFKRLNDTQGHQAGDSALVRTAAALRAAVRDIGVVDVVARYGGDEFAVIQPGSDPAAALTIGGRLRGSVEALGIVADPQTGRLLSASVGVARFQQGQEPDAVVAAADAALYRAKARGGGVDVAEASDRSV